MNYKTLILPTTQIVLTVYLIQLLLISVGAPWLITIIVLAWWLKDLIKNIINRDTLFHAELKQQKFLGQFIDKCKNIINNFLQKIYSNLQISYKQTSFQLKLTLSILILILF